jgi:predicted AAA+ superfamily ATPase
MTKIRRNLAPILQSQLARGKSILLLGPRQVGKTTLLADLPSNLTISLLERKRRLQLEKDPERLFREIAAIARESRSKRPLIFIDEIQKVPSLLDIIQKIIDDGKAQFILTGSSARKLRRQQEVNLLPGRIVQLRLDPLMLTELDNPALEPLLLDGSLPAIYLTRAEADRARDLISYVETYLEEEVRVEALVRKVGEFARFIELAGIESGHVINCAKIGEDLGVNPKTVSTYYEILEDCLIAERIEPITMSSSRKRLTKSARYLIFDMGVRRAGAGEGTALLPSRMGELLEQFVGLELIRQCRLLLPRARVRFWRDPDGPEIDWVLESHGKLFPIEVKWTENPKEREIKNLITFLTEYKNAPRGYLVCRCSSPQRMFEGKIRAISWNAISEIIKSAE